MNKLARVPGFTIDGPTTRDMDDALWAEVRDGLIHVWVSISRVATKVARGSEWDQAAAQRLATRYYATSSQPMLPHRLTYDRLSLRPGQPRGVICVEFDLDEALEARNVQVHSAVLESAVQFNYADIPDVLYYGAGPVYDPVELLVVTATDLLEKRRAAGALALYDAVRGWTISETGTIVKLAQPERNVGYVVVQEFMILANYLVACWLRERELPALYRNHHLRDGATAADLKAAVPGGDLRAWIDTALAAGPEALAAVATTIGHLFGKATYGAAPEGHLGLALPSYVHSTSPIRRYVDLVNQRQIVAALQGSVAAYTGPEIAALAEDITTRQQAAAAAKEAVMKARAVDLSISQARVLDVRRAGHYSDHEWKMLVKAAVEVTGPTPEFVDTFRQRAAGKGMQEKDLFRVLFETSGEGWDDVRAAALEYLRAHPGKGISLLMLGRDLQDWLRPEMVTRPVERGFECMLSLIHEGEKRQVTAKGSNKRQAETAAAVVLIHGLIGVAAPEHTLERRKHWDERMLTKLEPIQGLIWLADVKGWPPPEYTFDVRDREQPVDCEVRLGDLSATGRGRSKQIAKRQAAQNYLQKLRSISPVLVDTEAVATV